MTKPEQQLTAQEIAAVDTFFSAKKKRLHSCPKCKKQHLKMLKEGNK